MSSRLTIRLRRLEAQHQARETLYEPGLAALLAFARRDSRAQDLAAWAAQPGAPLTGSTRLLQEAQAREPRV